MGLPGLEGRPATAAEMEWLLRRSVGLGLPAPASLSPAESREWEPDDLHSFTDQVDYAAVPLGRTVQVTGRGAQPIERHVAVMSVGRLEEIEAPDPGHEPWLAHTDRLPFPVEWTAQFDILSGGEARQAIQRKLLVVRDMQRHYREHDLDEPLALDRQARQARQVEDQMSRGVDVAAARLHGWFRLAVAGRTEDECLEKARKVIASYRGRRVTIEHPRGQYGLLREFIPGEPVSTSAYRRRLPVLYFAAGVPTASSQVGDRRGPYVGYTAGASRRAVMFDTHYATEVKETSGLVPVVGGLGAGKSVLLGQITYDAVRRGIPSVVLDPSGPLARLTELPELREHSEHIDLTTAHSGTLNPFAVVARPSRQAYRSDDALAEAEVLAAQDRKLLAMDVVKMLLPPSLDAMPQTSLVVSDAVRATRGEPDASLWDVVTNLESLDEQHGKVVANYLRDMAELPLARLFFPADDRASERLDATLTVLTMPGLVLPPRNCAARTLVDLRAARRARCCTSPLGTPPAPSTAGPWRLASSSPSTRRTSSGTGPPAGLCSPAWAGTRASGTPASSPLPRTRRTCSAWTSPTSCPPRSWAGSRTTPLPRTPCGCSASRPASATSEHSPRCRPAGAPPASASSSCATSTATWTRSASTSPRTPTLLEALNTTARGQGRRRGQGAGRMIRRLAVAL